MPVPLSHRSSGRGGPPGEVLPLSAMSASCCRCRCPRRWTIWFPEGAAPPEPGTFVRVPLGQRSLVGVVWDGADDELPVERLKPVLEVLPLPRLRPELRRFVERVAAYTMAPPGTVLRMAMSVAEALETPRPRRLCVARPAGLAALAGTPTGKRLTPARRRVLEVLRKGRRSRPPSLPGLPGAARASFAIFSPAASSRNNSLRPSRPSPRRPTGACPVPRCLPTSRSRRTRLVEASRPAVSG